MSLPDDHKIRAEEHFYSDDPNVGHPDVRTELGDANYYFLGNGLIQAAVQDAPRGDGSPLGLLVMNPERLRNKRQALTMDRSAGVGGTRVCVRRGPTEFYPRAGAVQVGWDEASVVPAVVARWRAGVIAVEERFVCPRLDRAVLLRVVRLENRGRAAADVEVATGVRDTVLRRAVRLPAGSVRRIAYEYTLNAADDRVTLGFARSTAIAAATRRFWSSLAQASFGDPQLDHFFRACCRQLPVAISRRGVMDGSIWQYNREWVRDQAKVALALTMIGAHRVAEAMFRRLLAEFVTPAGDTVDSSERRDPPEVELDQNGILLYTLCEHVCWTGNWKLVRDHWAKIEATAEFPLRPVFRHEASGLLMNRREYWERHRLHGIETGLELAHQFYVVHGLAAAARMARRIGRPGQAERWAAESERLRTALLHDPVFRMSDERGFIKRRAPDGAVQETVEARPEAALPEGSPLVDPGAHCLNPDASAALPIALGVVAANAPVSRATIKSLDKLWNQRWKGGGYGRYHVTSEPDSPGAWPFASLFVARAALEAGDHNRAWRVLRWLGRARGARAGTWSEFYGHRIAPPFPQVGFVPWNWAEIVFLLVHHVLGVRPEVKGVRLQPRLLRGLSGATASLTVRGRRLRVALAADRSGLRARVAGRTLRPGPDGVELGGF